MFNSAAQKLFGFAHPSEKGMKLAELPLNNTARQALMRRHRSVIHTGKQSNIHNAHLTTNRFEGVADIHFTPLSTETGHGVIVMFQVDRNNRSAFKKPNDRGSKRSQQNGGSRTKSKKTSRKRR
jgi:hypothetical protein